MTTPMHDLFDDLAATVPGSVTPPELAKRAYADGRRRRRARQLRAASITAVVVLLATLVLPTTVAPELKALTGASGSEGVDGYPRRIDHQWIVRTLPDRPGRMAGLFQAVHHTKHGDQPDGWYAFNANGHRWRIPEAGRITDQYPNLSNDGRRLGYLAGENGPYVVRDLVTGRRVKYDQIGDNRDVGTAPYMVFSQSPAFWSPDDRRLLLYGATRAPIGDSVLLLEPGSGLMTEIPRRGSLAGWSGNDRVVWLQQTPADLSAPAQRIDVVETDLQGKALRRVRLRGAETWLDFPGQWSASMAPNGEQLALSVDSPSPAVHRFSIATGLEVGPRVISTRFGGRCGLAWRGGDVVVPVLVDDTLISQRLRPSSNGETVPVTLSVVSPRVGATCLMWAADAIGGSARGGWPMGTRTETWTWWWREWVLGAGLAAGVVGLLLYTRRRLRRRHRGPSVTL